MAHHGECEGDLMQCDFQQSDKTHKGSGLPYWICSREGCGMRCLSAECQTSCRSGVVVEIVTQAKSEMKEVVVKSGCSKCEAARKVKERIRELLEQAKRERESAG